MDQFFVVYQPADRVTLSGAARTARVEGMGGEEGRKGESSAGLARAACKRCRRNQAQVSTGPW